MFSNFIFPSHVYIISILNSSAPKYSTECHVGQCYLNRRMMFETHKTVLKCTCLQVTYYIDNKSNNPVCLKPLGTQKKPVVNAGQSCSKYIDPGKSRMVVQFVTVVDL